MASYSSTGDFNFLMGSKREQWGSLCGAVISGMSVIEINFQINPKEI